MPILLGTTPPVGPVLAGPGEFVASQQQPVMTWTGYTGETWQITGNFQAKTLMEADGRTGLLMPPVEHYSNRSATSDGETWEGYNVLPRPVSMPLIFIGTSPQDMREESARFLNTMHPGEVGTFTVTNPDGGRRSLQLRYQEGGEGDFGANGYGIYWMRAVLKLTAFDPFYYGDAIVEPFDYAPGANFYGGGVGTSGPPYYISSSRSLDIAKIRNVGDAEAYGVWRAYGPFTTASVGFVGKSIQLTFPVATGHYVDVFTDRRDARIVDDSGANRWGDVGAVTFAPLPRSATTELQVSVAGAGAGTRVEFTYVPKFWRAW